MRLTTRRALRVLLFAAAGCVGHSLLFPAVCSAEEITTVNVTKAGPDRSLPTSAFYVAGTASTTTTKVQSFLVRATTPTIFRDVGESCSSIGTQFTAALKAQAKGSPPLLGNVTLPNVEARAIWAASEWERGKSEEGKETPFKTLIAPPNTFFLSGAQFCLLVYETRSEPNNDATSVLAAIKSYVSSLDACTSDPCAAKADDAFANAVGGAITRLKLDERSAAAVKSAALDGAGTWKNLAIGTRHVRAVLDSWWATHDDAAKATVVRPSSPPKTFTFVELRDKPFTATPVDSNSAFERGLTELLVQRGKLSFATAGGGRTYTVTTSNMATPPALTTQRVSSGAFTGDYDGIDALTATGGRVDLNVALKDLTFDATDVTVRDLLELQRNRVRVDRDYLRIDDLVRKVSSVFDSDSGLSAEQQKLLTEVQQRFEAISRYVDRARSAAAQLEGEIAKLSKPPPGGGGQLAMKPGVTPTPTAAPHAVNLTNTVDAMMGEWLRGVLASCNATMATWPNGLECKPGPEFDFGFARNGNQKLATIPIGYLAQGLRELTPRLDKSKKLRDEVTIKTLESKLTPSAEPFGSKISFSQDTWFFSYVTPSVGYAGVLNGSEKFPIAYVSAQVHLVPNPVNEPLWTNGSRDVLRLIALELGASLPATTYGPGDRYRGWEGLPPFFFGGTLHVLPYTGISAGGVVVERRSTPLAGESASTELLPYFALSVQANVPDVVRGLTEKSKTKTE